MKVSTLITRLKKLDKDKEIFFSCDEEGNRIFRQIFIETDEKNNYCMFPDESQTV